MLHNFYLVEKGTGKLVSPFKRYEWTKPIEPARPFSVTSVTTVVAHDLDGILRGKNDILILTKSSLGQQPLVDRIHFFEKEVEKGEPIQNLFANSVYVCDDYNGDDRLWLELNVLEIDSDTGERKAAANSFHSLASTAGAVFPVALPYAMAASTGVKLVEKLVSAFEKDTEVVRIPISFYPGEPRRGYAPFQEGTYVAFAGPQQPDPFVLSEDGKLTSDRDISEISYTVFDIYEDIRVSPEFIRNQQIATLLTQLSGGNKNTTKSSLDFLTETLTGYSNYRKLERYIELSGKSERTDQENELMEEISKIDGLAAFLPTN